MILADSAVWIDHLRSADTAFATQLEAEMIAGHPFVAGEVALGSLHDRRRVLARLHRLEQLPVARHDAVMALVEIERLYSLGIGYIDAHLLASVRLVPGARLWTRDKRLRSIAERLGIAAMIA